MNPRIPSLPQPCASCPFLRANHRQRHGAAWYTVGNLRRLWNGLRTGKAPGMVCHATDPESIHYGGTKAVKHGIKRECLGANILIQRELNMLRGYTKFREYRRARPTTGLTRSGLAFWLNRIVFSVGGVPGGDPNADVGLPWREKPK